MRITVSITILLAGLVAAALAVADDHGNTAAPGEEIYATHCARCHQGGFGGFFTGAPKVGKKKDWKELTPKGLDALTTSTINGIGKMEPRGECAACSDEEIRAAVAHMLAESQ